MQVGRPYELDPRTLDTKGEDDMGGQVGQRMAGHYSVVQEPDGDLRCVCFGTQVRTCCELHALRRNAWCVGCACISCHLRGFFERLAMVVMPCLECDVLECVHVGVQASM